MEPARSNFRYGEGYKVDRDNNEPNNPLNEVPRTTEAEHKKNLVVGSLWMVGLTMALFFLPAVNGLIAGTVGGYMVGSMKRAVLAAVLPAFAAAIGLWVMLATLDFPVVGFFVGAAMGVHIILSEIGLFLGAAIGGTVAQTKVDRYNRG